MTVKLKDKDPLAFLRDYTVDELKQAIAGVVAEIAREHSLLSSAKEHPKSLTDAEKTLLGTERRDLTTVDLAQWRIAFWESVQDRLWHWYRTRSGQATESGSQGGNPLG
jgi:uncharacterized small protein (DUF1192 family)